MHQSSRWQTDVTQVMGLFRDALLALLPVAERAKIAWREPHNYDDWDEIASALFRSLVIRNVEHAAGWDGFAAVAPYDSVTSYENRSYICNPDIGPGAAFTRLQTRVAPFDTCVFARLEEGRAVGEALLPFGATRFAAVGIGVSSSVVLRELSVVL